MRKVVLYIAISTDGFIARKDGSVDWLPEGGEDYGYNQFMETVDTVLLGRTTYDQLFTFNIEYPYKEKKNYVFTRKTTGKSSEYAEFESEPISLVKRLKQEPGKDIFLVGGAKLFQSLLKEGLVDEMILFIIPHLLGEGIPLFANINEAEIDIVESTKYDTGVVKIHYRINR